MLSIDSISESHIAVMQSIASERWAKYGPAVDHHIGDIAWSLRDRSKRTHLVLLDDLAYAVHHEDPYRLSSRPGHEELFGQLIDAARNDPVFWALDTEAEKIDALRSRGFLAEDAGHTWHLVCDLDDLPDLVIPEGWTVRDATDPSHWPARVEVHRAAWHPSSFTAELYDAVRATPPYRADLDVGIVSSAGRWAAYCIAWLDDRAKVGELEPVGVAPEFRRQGLGAAACLAALHRLRDAGATRCVVGAVTDPQNQGPRRLYESLGFRVAARLQSFRRA